MWGELAPPTAPQERLCHGQGDDGGLASDGRIAPGSAGSPLAPPPLPPDRRLRASWRPATPWLRAAASASDRPWGPLRTIIWSTDANGLAAASTIAGHFSASCWPMTASWFSARASARALIASASAMPLACTASPSARPLAAVAAAPAAAVDTGGL